MQVKFYYCSIYIIYLAVYLLQNREILLWTTSLCLVLLPFANLFIRIDTRLSINTNVSYMHDVLLYIANLQETKCQIKKSA